MSSSEGDGLVSVGGMRSIRTSIHDIKDAGEVDLKQKEW